MDFEKQFHMDVPDDVLGTLNTRSTVGDAWQVLVRPGTEQSALAAPRWATFVGLIARMCDMPPTDVHWDTQPFE
ncbi:MAG TPA: hypothetical protein VNW46_02500 [Gemmatimonadaceae bacterium]|nr:hypothetical protein [Gemmatimonadaceae bacterium]